MSTRALILLSACLYGVMDPGDALGVQQTAASLNDADAAVPANMNNMQLIDSKLAQAEHGLHVGETAKARKALIQARILNRKAQGHRATDIELLSAAVQMAAGQTERAETTLKNLITQLPEHSAKRAAALNNLGNLYMDQHRVLYAHQAYEQALQSAQEAPGRLRLKVALNQVQALQALARYPEALARLQPLIDDLNRTPADAGKVPLLLTAAQRLSEIPTTETNAALKAQRYQLLHEAETLSTEYSLDNHRASALMALSTLYKDNKRFEEALRLSREALFYAQRANAPPLLVRIHWQLARLHVALDDEAAALNAYREALGLLDEQSDQLSRFSAGWRHQPIAELLEEAADAVLQKAARDKDPDQKEKSLEQVRHIIELARADSLRRYFRDDCVADFQHRTQGVEHIDASTLVIYPIALADRLELLVSGSDFITHVRVPVSRQALDQALVNLRTNLQFGSPGIYQYSAHEVYRWLIEPIEPLLEKVQPQTLVFVPNATLQMVPIAALFDGKQYLIERYAIATTPGLALTDPRAFPKQGLRMLIAGVSDAVQGYADLPYVKKEVTTLAKRYKSVLLLNDAFTVPALESELDRTSFPILHLASHGRFEPDVRTSYILSYDARMAVDEFQSVLTAGRFLDTPVELLTLSACSTAVGDSRSALGLGGLAVKSGARTALASLWLVSDRATETLMSAFYRQLEHSDTSRAQALQRAQQAMLSHPQYRNPIYWSAFVLVGNWQ